MADIRINALATTATTPASDDYLALDGTAQGTRKILATNIANNVTDVILGASGPSVKSTLSARAPRQGLVFDTTANATVASVAAFGTSDFTIAAIIRKDSLAAAKILIGGQSNSFGLTVNTNGTVITSLVNVADNTASTGTIAAGKTAVVVYSRSGTTGTYYINGVAAGTTTDSRNYSVAFTSIGGAPGNAAVLDGSLSVLAYNRALSASEVVSLYEAGVPSGVDYNTAGTTDIKPSAGTYAYWFGTGSISSATASSFTIVAGASNLAVRNVTGTLSVITGRRYRATIVASGLNASCDFGSQGFTSNLSASNISNGTSVIEFTATNTASGYFAISSISSTAGGSISISSIQALGLLLAPDAAQAGGGLVWYDTSGNAANITLPASGVSWNVPTSFSTAGGWTYGSTTPPTLQIANTTSGLANTQTAANNVALGTLKFGHPSDGQSDKFPSIVGRFDSTDASFARATQLEFYTSSSAGNALGMTLNKNGNFLLGTTADGGNGKLQLATHTTSAGGIGFGTDVSLYRSNAGYLTLLGTASLASQYFRVGSQNMGYLYFDTTDGYVSTSKAGASLVLRSGNEATALTLDSSQNAAFAKNVTIGSGVAASTLTIGTSTSSATVNVVAATDNTARINLDETAATNGAFWQYVGSTNTIQIGSRVSSTDTVAISFARASANVTVAGNLNITGTQNILGLPATADALGSNSTMTFELTSNTSLTIKVRGTDGNTRSVALTLA